MRKTPAIAIWCGARAYSNQGGGDVIAPDNLVCGHLILTAKLSGASRHRFSSKIAFSQFVEIEQQPASTLSLVVSTFKPRYNESQYSEFRDIVNKCQLALLGINKVNKTKFVG